MNARSAILLIAGLALVGACYDTPLIAADDDDEAAPTRSGSSTGGRTVASAGKPAKSGAGNGGEAEAGSPTKPNGGAAASANSGSGGQGGPEAGGDAGQAGEPSTPRISWLSLSASQAPGTDEPNRELGIQGYFYAYADSCAEMHWDPVSRCVSGRLCDPNIYADAWGVAVGFDFRNTGALGSPPDTKLLWNPDAVGARGVTWRMTGIAPSLQVWVLNMDESYAGQCDVMSCEIAGPPDGVDVASLNGELLFGEMKKDWWGGAGISYAFDPAAVFALQIKLPAIRARDAAFDFCIEELGVIR